MSCCQNIVKHLFFRFLATSMLQVNGFQKNLQRSKHWLNKHQACLKWKVITLLFCVNFYLKYMVDNWANPFRASMRFWGSQVADKYIPNSTKGFLHFDSYWQFKQEFSHAKKIYREVWTSISNWPKSGLVPPQLPQTCQLQKTPSHFGCITLSKLNSFIASLTDQGLHKVRQFERLIVLEEWSGIARIESPPRSLNGISWTQ